MNIALVVFNLALGIALDRADGPQLSWRSCAARQARTRSGLPRLTLYPGRVPFAAVYPLVTARALARPFTYDGRGGGREGRDRGDPVRAPPRPRDRRRRSRASRPKGSCRSRSSGSSGRCRRRSSTSRSGSPTTTARRPARALALVAPELPKRRKIRRRPAERQSLRRRSRAAPRSPTSSDGGRADRRRDRRRSGRRVPALRRDRLREDRGLPPGLRRRARARPRRDPARAGDRARAADGRPRAGALRRPRRDPALGPHRRRAPRRARADR